ncbi:MAG: tetratricopeptide repeat protein [Methanobacteriaceae archaeon]|jgi:tetratricopeptide (TPR) repeat protein|nr:tetratricopeptide repeat protein [Methanobacteriaceae archaeon]
MSKEEIKLKEDKLLEMVKAFCEKHLDEEYKDLSIKLVKKMGRKHDVPFKRGKLEIWASGVVYALGQINFLFDDSFSPYLSADDICDYFGTKKSTVGDKAKRIREMFKMQHFDKEFSTSQMKDKGMVVMDNGFMIPESFLKEKEESNINLLSLIAEQLGDDDKNLESFIKEEFLKGKNEKDTAMFLDIISTPMPEEMAYGLFNEIFNEKSDSSFFDFDFEEDDIELFEDYVIDENNPLETIEDYDRAIELFKNTKGEEYFEEYKGFFWGMHETRPFMTNLFTLSRMLWDENQKERAINQLKYCLELNPEDNQGVRYLLIDYLLELNKLDEVKDLLDFFDEEYSANWNFSKLLFSIKSKDDKKIIKNLYDEAIATNEYVVPYLIGKKKIPQDPPEFYSMGDESEALFYINSSFNAWNNDKIAIDLLKELYK